MGITKQIVCLANSRKRQGRCVGGREWNSTVPGSWIRPISERSEKEVSGIERQYEDFSDPRVLDLIQLPLIEARPKDYQQENWLLDPTQYWVRTGTLGWESLSALRDRSGPLWINGNSTYHGIHDRIPLAQAVELRSSLKLIHVEGLKLKVFAPGEARGDIRRRVQARFVFDGTSYGLWVTDPIAERQHLARSDGEYAVDEAYLTISISEPYQDFCYKIVATVIRGT
jgi:hypothetical protein